MNIKQEINLIPYGVLLCSLVFGNTIQVRKRQLQILLLHKHMNTEKENKMVNK